MEEVRNGSSNEIRAFIDLVATTSLETAMEDFTMPAPAKEFMTTSFDFINSGKPHVIAAAFALGREHIIPEIFRALLDTMNITKDQTEVFHYYLERHIHLDADQHGPMSLRMLEILCDNDPIKIAEAEAAAINAVQARIHFWDGVLKEIKK